MFEDRANLLDIRKGRPDALRTLYRKYKSPLYTVACALADTETQAADALAETFTHLAANSRQYRLTANPLKILCRTLIENIRSTFDQDIYEVTELEDAPPPPPPEEQTNPFPTDQFLTALRRVPYNRREALALHLIAKLTIRQVAAILNVPASTVQSRCSYGLEDFQSVIESELIE